MGSVILSLTKSLGLVALWGIFDIIIPILAISVLFSLGMRLIRWILWSIHFAGADFKDADGNSYRPTVYRNGKRVY